MRNSFKERKKKCYVELGRRIKTRREELELTQEDVSEKIGITQVYLSQMERGERDLDLFAVMEICKIFGIDINELI